MAKVEKNEVASKPSRIRVVNEGDMGHTTKVYDEAGNDITKELMLTGVDLRLRVDEPNTATLYVLALHGDVTAEVTAIETMILPPPVPKPQIRTRIGPPFPRGFFGRTRSAYRIERVTPVHEFGDTPASGGALIVTLAEGWMKPIGPLEFTVDA